MLRLFASLIELKFGLYEDLTFYSLFAFCGFVRARAREAMANVTGTKGGAPLDLLSENEFVSLFVIPPSTTAPLIAAVGVLQQPQRYLKFGDV